MDRVQCRSSWFAVRVRCVITKAVLVLNVSLVAEAAAGPVGRRLRVLNNVQSKYVFWGVFGRLFGYLDRLDGPLHRPTAVPA